MITKKHFMLHCLLILVSLWVNVDARSSSCTSNNSCAQFQARAACCLGKPRFVENGGVSIAYTVSGNCKGPAIVFIHGFGLSGEIFLCQCKQLSPYFQIVTVDLRGFGRSDQSPTLPLSYALWASDVAAVINALGLVKPIIAGFSIGSIVAELYAATNSNISKLILMSPYDGQFINTPNALCPACPAYSNGVPLEALAPLIALLPDRAAFDQAGAEVLVPETCTQAPTVRSAIACIIGETSTESFGNVLASGVLFSGVTALLPSISVPTLLLSGSLDPLMNTTGLAALLTTIPDSRLMQFPGGHMFNITQSGEVNRAIFKFITQNANCCDVCF